MEIVNIRIDDRLIHGQVAAVWSQTTGANRIMLIFFPMILLIY